MTGHWWAVSIAGVDVQRVTSSADGLAALMPGENATWIDAMPRALHPGERWDHTGKAIVADVEAIEAAIDGAFAEAGYDKRAIHARKAIEARRFARSGFLASMLAEMPMLKREAEAMGMTPRALAEQIIAHDDATIAAEIERRRAKQEARTA